MSDKADRDEGAGGLIRARSPRSLEKPREVTGGESYLSGLPVTRR